MKSVFTGRYGAFLRAIVAERKAAGLTQQALAEKLNKPQSFVSKYERGERRLDVIEFLDVAKAIGVAPQKILAEVQEDCTPIVSGNAS